MSTQATTRRQSPWVALGVLALAVLALAGGPAAAQAPLRWSRNEPGDAQPITLYADTVTTWVDQGRRAIVLKGRVWIEQGLVRARLLQGVVWLDESQKQRTGIYHLDIYGEGTVTVEDGSKLLTGAEALLELNTRGEIRINSYQGKVGQTPAPADPLYVRAAAIKANPALAGNGPAAPGKVPPTSAVQSAQKPATYAAPGGTTPLEQSPPVYQSGMLPPPSPSPAAPIQRTGAFETVVPVPPVAPPAPPPPDAGTWTPGPPGAVPLVPVQQGSPGPPGVPQAPMQPGGLGPAPMSPPGSSFPGPPSQDPFAPPSVPLVPPPLPSAPAAIPPPAAVPLPPQAKIQPAPRGNGPPRQFTMRPRGSLEIKAASFPQDNDETAIVINTGVILTITNIDAKQGILDIEADRLVLWNRGNNTQDLLNNMRSPQGQQSDALEFYLSGNVEIRSKQGKDERLLRAVEVYYDVSRNVAIALKADLEIKQKFVADPLHIKAEELQQLNAKLSHVIRTELFSSKLPSDPGLKVVIADGDLEQKEVPKKSIFGRPVISRVTGLPETDTQEIFTGRNAFLDLELASDIYVPVFYWPWFRGDARDPLGPLENIGFNYNTVFGFQLLTTFDMFDLLGIDRAPGERWKLKADEMTMRGPALGMDYDLAGKEIFGIPGLYTTSIRAYGMNDVGKDILGGNRGQEIFINPFDIREIDHPENRGRLSVMFNGQNMPDGFMVQMRMYALSDRNFMEQFFPYEYNNGPDEETSVYVKQQHDNWAWTALAEQRIRDWMTETSYLPRVDGYLLGEKLFGLFTYNVRGDVTYARLQVADLPPPDNQPPPFYTPTDQNDTTGRFDILQELSLPFTFGAFTLVPYATLDLAYYTQDLNGDDRGRFYGGLGLRGSIPFSRLYPDIQSELFNVNGIYHKIVLSSNFYTAHSDTPYTQLPQLDRINDDNSDKALRDLFPFNFFVFGMPQIASPVFNPQLYALRMLVDNRIDTLDSMEILQLDVRQRWQTKRGYPGQQHIIDWMTLDVSASFFPESNRDDFGHTLGFLQYDWNWNIGDRTALYSSGLFEPFENGAQTYNVGISINRPDRTTFTFSYRQIDPIDSKAVLAAVTYAFSPKYAVSASTLYDFGAKNYVASATLSRIGTDLQLNAGFYYSTLVNTFGFQLELIPNIVPANQRGAAGTGGIGSSLLGTR